MISLQSSVFSLQSSVFSLQSSVFSRAFCRRCRGEIGPAAGRVLNGRVRLPRDAPVWILVGVALAAFLIQSLRLWWVRRRPGRRLRAAAERGAAGEARAEQLLIEHGFGILARQATREWRFHVDDQEVPVTVRADFLVTRGGLRYVAEVKTGSAAPRPEYAPTRRQLLEYRHAFAVDGVLLVNGERDRIQQIVFPDPRDRSSVDGRLLWMTLGFFAGGLATLASLAALRWQL